jgi:hypothetical protein
LLLQEKLSISGASGLDLFDELAGAPLDVGVLKVFVKVVVPQELLGLERVEAPLLIVALQEIELVVRVVIGSLEHFFRYLEVVTLTVGFRLLLHNLNVLPIHGPQVQVSGVKAISSMKVDTFVSLTFPKGRPLIVFFGWGGGGILLGRRMGR